MKYLMCWICHSWTREDFMRDVEFNDKSEKVCLKCKNNLEERDRHMQDNEVLREEAQSETKGQHFGRRDRLPKTRGDLEEERSEF